MTAATLAALAELDAASMRQLAADDGQAWQRILWKRQPYPDNYVPPDFLKRVGQDADRALPTFSTLATSSLGLTQRLGTTLTFVGIFLYLQDGCITAESLAPMSIIGIALCGATMPTSRALHKMPSDPLDKGGRRTGSKKSRRSSQPLSYALLGLFILAVSPLLKTLTETTTSDSIAALSTTLFLISFALADFSSGIEPQVKRAPSLAKSAPCRADDVVPADDSLMLAHSPLPATLSLNAALCASTVLASRLRSPIAVFALVLSAIFLFAFLPRWIRYHVARQARLRSARATSIFSIGATLALLLSSVALLWRFSLAAAVADVLVAIFLSIVCPFWMRKAQRYKVSRRGPWDVSVPRLRQSQR